MKVWQTLWHNNGEKLQRIIKIYYMALKVTNKKFLITSILKDRVDNIKEYYNDEYFSFISLDDLTSNISKPELTTCDVLGANALKESKYYSKKLRMPVISEQQGLYVKNVTGWTFDCDDKSFIDINNDDDKTEEILQKLENTKELYRNAKIVLSTCFFNKGVASTDNLVLDGYISKERRGNNKNYYFSKYNDIFIPLNSNKTLAEMTKKEINGLTHWDLSYGGIKIIYG